MPSMIPQWFHPHTKDNNSSSSDSDEEDERRKFHVEIKPMQPNSGTQQHKATIDELKASIGNITLSPSAPVRDAYMDTYSIHRNTEAGKL